MNSCAGPSLGLALDECKEADHVVLADGNITLVIDQGLSRTCGAVKVDYIEKGSGCGGGEGFALTSARPLPRAGGGCGGSCASNGCGC